MIDDNSLTDTLVEDETPDEPAGGRWAWLVCIGSPEDKFASAGRVLPLEGTHTITFGRDESSEGISVAENGDQLRIGIPFGWVSGRHAELTVGDLGMGLAFSLRDMGSRNGTLLNGERLTDEVHLRPADVFEVGRSFWTVREVRLRKLRSHKLSELDPTGTCSPHLHHIHRTLHRLAQSSIPIVLRGETGTGKQYLAGAIHQVSGRQGPFVVANLGALSDHRVEEVLFGGASTPGLFEQANNGTLMLDELGELSPTVQGKLLSALTEGRAARVGEQDTRSFDVRLVCATLHDLSRMVESGRFRADLYSRLAGFVGELPPLRARREDLGLLTRAVIRDLQREGRPVRITSNAFRRMLMRAWPFNIRQLQ
ncbi:MAG: sigma 54-interacting transcriptional regulator, partial [Deltaproteobacteria bacterium]|nr:sigma 54-interacting transcriptional regulator [Deltaproteobacteria bacterium]